MRKIFIASLFLVTASLFAGEPAVYKNPWNGVVMAYTANSYTNSTLEVGIETNAIATIVPYRISDVTATTNSTDIDFKLYRVETFEVYYKLQEVTTNFWGTVETNTADYGTKVTYLTNEVYNSTSSTLPVASWFLPRDILLADFDGVTNVQFRAVGTAQ